MTEKEYINATNLAKLRLALSAVGNVLAMHGVSETDLRAAGSALATMIDKLEPLVTTGRRSKQKDA